MTEHYYAKNPGAAHDERGVIFEVLGLQLKCTTDSGVFSREGLDMGTRILLEALPEVSGRVLDLGCGWGPIGTALALKNPQAQLVMADINERALALTRKNLKKNRAQAEVIESDGFDSIEGQFSHVVTNPPIRTGKQAIYAMFDAAFERLETGGTLTIVIRKQQGAPSALKHFEETYGNAQIVDKDAGYWIIRARKEGQR